MTSQHTSRFPESSKVGVAEIDDDHRELFDHIRTTAGSPQGVDARARGGTLRSLVAHFRDHFAREEKLMENSGFREWRDHAEHHKRFIGRLEQRVAAVESGRADESEFRSDALDMLFRDALNRDVEFATWFNHARRR